MRIRLWKMIAALCAALILLAGTACAQTVEPIRNDPPESLAGTTVQATIKAYDEGIASFYVILYEQDTYLKDDIAALQPGDVLIFCDEEHVIASMGLLDEETVEIKCEDGEEILLDEDSEGVCLARSVWDDKICMHIWVEWNLLPAEGITLTDASDLEKEEPVVTTGLEAILEIQRQREAESIVFDYSVTEITLNEAEEITDIRVSYAPWQ